MSINSVGWIWIVLNLQAISFIFLDFTQRVTHSGFHTAGNPNQTSSTCKPILTIYTAKESLQCAFSINGQNRFSIKSPPELRKPNFSLSSGNFSAIRDTHWKALDMLFSASIGSWGWFAASLLRWLEIVKIDFFVISPIWKNRGFSDLGDFG